MKNNPWYGLQKAGYRMYCAAGVANPAGKGLGVVFADVDGLLRNDRGNRNRWIALLPQGRRSNRSDLSCAWRRNPGLA